MDAVIQKLHDLFPDPDFVQTLLDEGEYMELEEGSTLINIGNYIKVVPIVLEGSVKVSRMDEKGNELYLYHIHPGNTCAMTLNCCRANQPSEVHAVTDEATSLIALPVTALDQLTNQSKEWKRFVMHTFRDRFDELLNVIDSIAFLHLDERLIKYLQDKSQTANSPVLHLTHQQIADDINSSREVISRLLKQLENQGKIKLGRHKIELVNVPV